MYKYTILIPVILFSTCFFCISAGADCLGTVTRPTTPYDDGVDGPYENGEGTVTDLGTELMWQKESWETGARNWSDACTFCDVLVLAGHDDWELPNVDQLQSLLDTRFSPAINAEFFPDTGNTRLVYWSGSSYAENTEHAWYVSFDNEGDVVFGEKSFDKHVRCVRRVSAAENNLVIQASAAPQNGTSPLSVSFTTVVASGNPPFEFSWDFGDGGQTGFTSVTESAFSAEHTYEQAGVYQARVLVSDAAGQRQTQTVQVSVEAGAVDLLIDASATPSDGSAPLSVLFTSVVASGNPPFEFSWDFGDGEQSASEVVNASTFSAEHTYEQAGVYQARILVSDAAGQRQTQTVQVTVGESVAELTIEAAATQINGVAPFSTSFSCIVNSGNPPFQFSWDFGDGTEITSERYPNHTYALPGTYEAVCTVRDEKEQRATAVLQIVVLQNEAVLIRVKGLVYDAATGRAIGGADLEFRAGTSIENYAADRNGYFDITDVESGNYIIEISADDYQTKRFEDLNIVPGTLYDLTIGLEQNSPQIINIWAEPDPFEIVNNTDSEVIFHAEVSDPDSIADIRSVVLNLSDIDSSLKRVPMELTNRNRGLYEASVFIPGRTHARHYAVSVTAEDASGFEKYQMKDFEVKRKNIEMLEASQTARVSLENNIHTQTLVISVEVNPSFGKRYAAVRSASLENCFVRVNIYTPDGTLYLTKDIDKSEDIEIKKAVSGTWTYETINFCAESVDVEIETRGEDTGIITGTVKDSTTGSSLQNASVAWSLGGTDVTVQGGYFSIVAVAGTSALVSSAENYKVNIRTDVSLASGKTTTVSVKLIPDTSYSLPVPEGQHTELILNPAHSPDPLTQPFTAAIINNNLIISALFAPYQKPVNIYLGVSLDHPDFSSYFFLFNTQNMIDILKDSLFPWRENDTDWNQVELLSVPASLMPEGKYTFYFLITDEPVTLSTYELKFFSLTID